MTAIAMRLPICAGSVDQDTADTLGLIASDPIHATDRSIICDAIRAEAATNPAGEVDPNSLRARLQGQVHPPTIGGVVFDLVRLGAIRLIGWTETTGSTSGNNGKPTRIYRLVDASKLR